METDEATRDFALNEWELLPTRVGVPLSLRTVCTKARKLTVDLISGAGEMYDMQADPGERVNLFDGPKSVATKEALMAASLSRPDDAKGHQMQLGMA